MLLAFDTLTRQHGPGPLTVSAEEVFNAMLQVNFSGISGQVVRSFVRSFVRLFVRHSFAIRSFVLLFLFVCLFGWLVGWLVGLFVLLLLSTAYSVCALLRLVCVYVRLGPMDTCMHVLLARSTSNSGFGIA